jgi:hypothetical protein
MPFSRKQEKTSDHINQSVNHLIKSTCDYVCESDDEEKFANNSLNSTKLYESPSTNSFRSILESQIKNQQKLDFLPLNSSLNLLEESREANNLFCKSTKYLIGKPSHQNKSLTSENLFDDERISNDCVSSNISQLNLNETLFKSSSVLTSKSSARENYENQQYQQKFLMKANKINEEQNKNDEALKTDSIEVSYFKLKEIKLNIIIFTIICLIQIMQLCCVFV